MLRTAPGQRAERVVGDEASVREPERAGRQRDDRAQESDEPREHHGGRTAALQERAGSGGPRRAQDLDDAPVPASGDPATEGEGGVVARDASGDDGGDDGSQAQVPARGEHAGGDHERLARHEKPQERARLSRGHEKQDKVREEDVRLQERGHRGGSRMISRLPMARVRLARQRASC